MAVITPTISPDLTLEPTVNAIVVTWEQINHDDQGGAVEIPLRFADRTIQVVGDFTGSATYSLQGAFSAVGPWTTLSNTQGDPLTFSEAGEAVVPSNFPFYRVLRAAGTAGADADVFMSAITGR